MNGLSSREISMVSDLEFRGKYYFSFSDVEHHFVSRKQMFNTLYSLRKKGRVVKLNRHKFFLVPIKARAGKWVDNPLIVVDELFDGCNYFVGGFYAAFYWGLIDQIPFQVDVFTTKRQGVRTLFNKKFVFHRTTLKRISNSVVRQIEGHDFRVLSLEETKKWLSLKK